MLSDSRLDDDECLAGSCHSNIGMDSLIERPCVVECLYSAKLLEGAYSVSRVGLVMSPNCVTPVSVLLHEQVIGNR